MPDDNQLWLDQDLPLPPIVGTGGGGGPNGGNKLTDIDIAADKIEQLYGWGRHASDEVIRQGQSAYLPADGVSQERQMEAQELPGISSNGEVPQWARRLGKEVVQAFPDFLAFWKHASDAERRAIEIGIVASTFIPGVGDAIGAAADFADIAQNPDSRTLTNVGFALVSLIPGVPSIGRIRKLRRTILAAAKKGKKFRRAEADKIAKAQRQQARADADRVLQAQRQHLLDAAFHSKLAKIELIARVFAETGVKRVFRSIPL